MNQTTAPPSSMPSTMLMKVATVELSRNVVGWMIISVPLI